MINRQIDSINKVLKECFWGEYNLTPEEILTRLDRNDEAFNKFLFSKIVENSKYPSRSLKNIFSPTIIESLIKEYLFRTKENRRLREKIST